MSILKKVPQNNAILVSERGEEIQLIEQPKQPNNTPSVTGSVPGSFPPSDFSQIEFPLMEVVNQSQIDSSSISDMLDLAESNNSLRKASKSTDLPLKSTQNSGSSEEIKEFRDSVKPPQFTRDSHTIIIIIIIIIIIYFLSTRFTDNDIYKYVHGSTSIAVPPIFDDIVLLSKEG